MTAAYIVLGVGGLVAVLVVVWLVVTYNRLVTLRQRLRNAGSQIDVQLKRRHDLIPNLVETVRGQMAHERETLEAVTQARQESVAPASTDWQDASEVRSAAVKENALLAALSKLMVRIEAYPTLKSDVATGRLMEELASTENRIAFARQAFNDAVTVYNTKRQTVPTNLVAGLFGFHEAALFEVDDAAEREVVRVGDGLLTA